MKASSPAPLPGSVGKYIPEDGELPTDGRIAPPLTSNLAEGAVVPIPTRPASYRVLACLVMLGE